MFYVIVVLAISFSSGNFLVFPPPGFSLNNIEIDDGSLTEVPPFPPIAEGIVLAGSPFAGELFVQAEVEHSGRSAVRRDRALDVLARLHRRGPPPGARGVERHGLSRSARGRARPPGRRRRRSWSWQRNLPAP